MLLSPILLTTTPTPTPTRAEAAEDPGELRGPPAPRGADAAPATGPRRRPGVTAPLAGARYPRSPKGLLHFTAG